MKQRSTFLALSGGLGILFGLPQLLMPAQMVSTFAMELTPGGILFVRSLGGMILCVSLMNWLARHAEDSPALRAILYGNLCIHVIGTVIDVLGVTSGAGGPQAWGSVVLHVILSGFFAKFAFAKIQQV